MDLNLVSLQQPKLGFFGLFCWIFWWFSFWGRKKKEDSATSENKTSFLSPVSPLFISEQTKGIFIHFYKHSPLQTKPGMRSRASLGRGAVSRDKPLETLQPHFSNWDLENPWQEEPQLNSRIFHEFPQAGTWTMQSIPKEPSRICGVNAQLKSLFKAEFLVFSNLFLFSCWRFSFSWKSWNC